MRFDELTLGDPDEELRLRFHAELTILSGLGALDRRSLADSILDAVGGQSAGRLQLTDDEGAETTIGGPDATSDPDALGALGTDAAVRRTIMLLSDQTLGTNEQIDRADEPAELREARAVLAELTAEVEAALNQQRTLDTLQAELDGLDHELESAREGLARREYAQVLAKLERVRAEAAAVQAGAASIDGDRHLLTCAEEARARAAVWADAEDARVRTLTTLLERAGELEEMDPTDRARVAGIPAEPATELASQIDTVRAAIAQRIALEHRIHELSVSKLPAPSRPEVAELGALDQSSLWETAERATSTAAAVRSLQIALGGLSIAGVEDRSDVIQGIETAHAAAEAAARAAAAAKGPGLVGIGAGVAVALLGALLLPLLAPVGIVAAAASGVVGVLRPAARRPRTTAAEHAALSGVDAPSYLAFHLRRIDASVDPELRARCDASIAEHRAAVASWAEITGLTVEPEVALVLQTEIQAYSESLRDLGETADEIDQLRRVLHKEAGPALDAARSELLRTVEPFLLDNSDLEVLDELIGRVQAQCELGAATRSHGELDVAETELRDAADRLEELLLGLGFDAGPLDARVGALEWAVTRASEREVARRDARPVDEIEHDLEALQAEADRRRRPEWSTVTGDDAIAPSIDHLEAARSDLLERLSASSTEVDLVRLSDRRTAVERRVAALEAGHSGQSGSGQPGAVTEIQNKILDHLRAAATAGPHGDPVPVVIDEVLARVPADRKWDVLDVLRRAARDQQLIYLTDDAFVAAWAHQRASDGTITLLELAPEPVS